jgi:prepilin-type N-terminal cleavage/methylation domain-containing protein
MKTRRAASRPSRRAGFTLVELMIAMTAGLVTLAGAYYMGNLSARSFNRQMYTAEMQSTLRTAMEQLQRDIARAGFLSAPDTANLANCAGVLDGEGAESPDNVAPTRLRGLVVLEHGSTQGDGVDSDVARILGGDGANLTRADSLTLFGNYETGDVYAVSALNLGGGEVLLESSREGFRRSFVMPGVGTVEGTFSQARFEEVFAVGRMVRIETNNRVFFRRITGVNENAAVNPTVRFTPEMPASCFSRATALITPLSMIRYRVETLPAAQYGPFVARNKHPGAERVALVRSEVDPMSPDTVLGYARSVVLDYAVEFQVDAVVDNNAGIGTPNYELVTAASAEPPSRRPVANFRALRVILSTRTESIEPRFIPPPMRTSLTDPLLSFAIPIPNLGAMHTRVRTLRKEIFLPNFL